MPELLTVFFSSMQGMFDTSIYNIVSSNVINFAQYITSIIINKNGKVLRNRALKIELGIVVFTILIPIAMIVFGIEANITIVPIFILAFIMFYYIKGNAYKVYKIKNINSEEIKKIEEEKKWVKHKEKLAVVTVLQLLGVGIVLFFVGNLLRKYIRSIKCKFQYSRGINWYNFRICNKYTRTYNIY